MMEFQINFDGEDCFIVVGGMNIAKRGHPDSPQAGTWISLEPGWEVISTKRHKQIHIFYNAVRVQ